MQYNYTNDIKYILRKLIILNIRGIKTQSPFKIQNTSSILYERPHNYDWAIINCLINDKDPQKAKKYTNTCLKNMFDGKYDIKSLKYVCFQISNYYYTNLKFLSLYYF